jgi:hypothetical protein
MANVKLMMAMSNRMSVVEGSGTMKAASCGGHDGRLSKLRGGANGCMLKGATRLHRLPESERVCVRVFPPPKPSRRVLRAGGRVQTKRPCETCHFALLH